MENVSCPTGVSKAAGFGGAFCKGRRGVLLREPERCPECNKVYLSLYALGECADHDGLDQL